MAAWNDDKNDKRINVPVPKKHNAGQDFIRYSQSQHISIVWNSKLTKKEGK